VFLLPHRNAVEREHDVAVWYRSFKCFHLYPKQQKRLRILGQQCQRFCSTAIRFRP
jgi:hypothetical protein